MHPPSRLKVLAVVLGLLVVTAGVRYALPVLADEDPPRAPRPSPAQRGFVQVDRPNSVDIHDAYDTSDLQIPADEIHELLPKDAIPALTDPKREATADVHWLKRDDRLIVLEHGDTAIGVPLRVLDWHEIVNLTIAGTHVAATYCPLCDSATVVSRSVPKRADSGEEQGATEVLEFGVSGALYNSNVLMYDRTYNALWSQLGMRAVSGPLAGTALRHYPVRLLAWHAFQAKYPQGEVISIDTGHDRNYGGSAYGNYFSSERLVVPVKGMGNDLPRKTLGVGIETDADSWFVPAETIGDSFALKTPSGVVLLTTTDAGISVRAAPPDVKTAQTFYYAWSAFRPETRVVLPAESQPAAPGP